MEQYNLQENYDKAINYWYKNKGHLTLKSIADLFNINYSKLTIMMKEKIQLDYDIEMVNVNQEIQLTNPFDKIDAFVNSQKYIIAHTTELYDYLSKNSRETIINNYHVQRSRSLQNNC